VEFSRELRDDVLAGDRRSETRHLEVPWNNSLLVGVVDGERADGYYFSAVLAIPRSELDAGP